jgi:phenylacetate-CoA ligase
LPNHLAETLFLALPVLRNVGATVYGLKLRRERYGTHYHEAVDRIRERETWANGQMQEYQNRRLREIIGIAARHVPYYRELFRRLGLSADDFASVGDLDKLPILEKEAVRADPLQFVDERLDPGQLSLETTSGTTGTSIRLYMSSRCLQERYAFFDARCRRVAGLRYGKDPHVTFGVKRVIPVERTRPPFWCYNHAGKQLYMSVFHLADRYIGYYCDEMRRRPYKALIGYASAISAIARYILERDIRDIRIPIAITSGEILLPHQRNAMESAFGCHVFDQYGCTELSVFGAEGPCGRMHLSPDYSVLELVDDVGQPVQPGTTGHVLGTSLINDAQILLRYRVGDVARLAANPCHCGSPLPVVEAVEGRSMNAVVLPDGRRVYRVADVASRIPSVKQYQVVQEAIGVFTIYAVATNEFGPAEAEQMAANLGDTVGRAKIRVEVVDSISRGPGRKSPSVISLVGAPYGTAASESGEAAASISVAVQFGNDVKTFGFSSRATVAEIVLMVSQSFGVKGNRFLLMPSASPGTALRRERTLESYGLRSGAKLLLTAVGTANGAAG